MEVAAAAAPPAVSAASPPPPNGNGAPPVVTQPAPAPTPMEVSSPAAASPVPPAAPPVPPAAPPVPPAAPPAAAPAPFPMSPPPPVAMPKPAAPPAGLGAVGAAPTAPAPTPKPVHTPKPVGRPPNILSTGTRPQPAGEQFTCAARLEVGSIGQRAGLGVILHGPWLSKATGGKAAVARYNLTPGPLPELDACPPSGLYPGRMNFEAGTKRSQMVDRMALRFASGAPGACTVAGEGANRIGKYSLAGTGAFRPDAKGAKGWDVALTRTYDPNAPDLPAANPKSAKPAARTPGAGALSPPRAPRASAPRKGAYSAAGKRDFDDFQAPGALGRKSHKKGAAAAARASEDRKLLDRPCLCVVYAEHGPGGHPLTVYRYDSVEAARDKARGLIPEQQCALRVGAEKGDGVLFPPDDDGLAGFLAACVRGKACPPPPKTPAPKHVVVLDIDAPAAKRRAWSANVAGFDAEERAARFVLHAFRTAGARLKSCEWHAFDELGATAGAKLRLHGPGRRGTGQFEPSMPLHDMKALMELANMPVFAPPPAPPPAGPLG